MSEKKPGTAVQQLQFLAGQITALDLLLQSLYAASDRKEVVNAAFMQLVSAASSTMLEEQPPRPHKDGFVMRVQAIQKLLNIGSTTDESNTPKH